MLLVGKCLSTHIFQFIFENIKPSKHQGGKKVAWCGYDLDHDMHISKCPLGRKKNLKILQTREQRSKRVLREGR